MKSALKRNEAAILAGLAREDWDFSAVKRGCEYYCRGYEFAREVPWILQSYKESWEEPYPLDEVSGHGFDEFGNWHYEESQEHEEGRDWFIHLQIPFGFPVIPYLRTKHQVYGEPDWEGVPPNLELLFAVIKDEAEMRAAGYSKV